MTAALNKFISQLADRCRPFFKLLHKWKDFLGPRSVTKLVRSVGTFFCILCVGLPSAVMGQSMLGKGVETSPPTTHPGLVCAQTMPRLPGVCLRQAEMFQRSHDRQT